MPVWRQTVERRREGDPTYSSYISDIYGVGFVLLRAAFCFLFSASCEVRASRDWQRLWQCSWCVRSYKIPLLYEYLRSSPLPCPTQRWRRHTRSPPPLSRFGTHTHWTASIGLLLRLGDNTFMGYLKSTFISLGHLS